MPGEWRHHYCRVVRAVKSVAPLLGLRGRRQPRRIHVTSGGAAPRIRAHHGRDGLERPMEHVLVEEPCDGIGLGARQLQMARLWA